MAESSGRLAGTGALITGASSGIGEATARAFVREGARVVLAARRTDLLAALAAELGPLATAHQADVADPQQVTGLVSAAAQWLGRLDVVVHSAGVSNPAPLAELTPERGMRSSRSTCRAAFTSAGRPAWRCGKRAVGSSLMWLRSLP